MEDKIWDILEKVRLEQLTVNEGMQQVLDLFAVMPSLQQDDSDMLFHECPNCNCRCNCLDQPCSCCNDA